jgi:hypothetical protein
MITLPKPTREVVPRPTREVVPRRIGPPSARCRSGGMGYAVFDGITESSNPYPAQKSPLERFLSPQ